MAPMPKVRTVAELYPPDQPDEVRSALSALTGERDRNRSALLRRALTGAEKTAMREHHAALAPYTDRGPEASKADAILAMMQGLAGPTLSREEALELTHQHVKVCADLPLWSVLRACDRFARGQVRPEEIGAKQMDPNYRPTTAALHLVAAKLAEPVLNRRYQIGEALRGVLMLAPTPRTEEEQRAAAERVEKTLAEFRRTAAENEMAEAADHAGAKIQEAQRLKRLNADLIEREYEAAGLPVPPWRGDMPPPSLSLLLNLGWSIGEDEHRQKVLVRPRAEPPPRKPAPPASDMNDAIPF